MGGESWGMVGRIGAVEVGGWGSEDITVVVSAISLGSRSWNMVERIGLENWSSEGMMVMVGAISTPEAEGNGSLETCCTVAEVG